MLSLVLLASITLKPLVTGLDRPVQAVFENGQLYVALQTGQIVIVNNGVAQPFLDLSSAIDCCENGGLLSFVFHPRYRENGRFFVMYVNRDGDTVIAEYGPTAHTLLVVDQPVADRPNHHGGTLQFGLDGDLYISVGDGGVGAGVTNRAQDLHLLLGKLLRIDVDHGIPYAIPSDNPFINVAGAAPEIWAYGLRNPWRFSFDPALSQLILGDVGEDSWEELNVVDVAASRGANFGWPRTEGMHCFPPGAPCDMTGITLPIAEYSHDKGCSITAGYRFGGDYVYGDWCSGLLFTASSGAIAQTGAAIVSFAQDDAGDLYIVDYRGSISRVEESASRRRAVRH